MKRTIIAIVMILLLGFGIAAAIYTYQAPGTTEVDVLRDVTEKFLAQPDSNEILGFYDLSGDNKWNGGEFLFTNTTDVSYNPTKEAKIDAVNQWLSNELDRDKGIKEFQKQVSTILANSGKDSIGRPYSSIYLPIARQLLRLSQSKANKRVLLVYSDLMENDPQLSFYSKQEFQLIQTHPESVKKQLEDLQQLPSLKGIEIHFIYEPTDTTEDIEYRAVSELYRQLLEDKGATVYISANLSN